MFLWTTSRPWNVHTAAALAAAWVGVAMASGGTALAITNADVALLDDDLAALPGLLRLGAACRATIWRSIALAMAVKLLVLALALAGAARLWFAVVADVAGLLVVVANGARLLAFDFTAAGGGGGGGGATTSTAFGQLAKGPSSPISTVPTFGAAGKRGDYQPLLKTFPQEDQAVSYGALA